MEKQKNILLGIAAAFLLLALVDGWEYGFFTMLRFVVFSTCAYVAYLALAAEQEMFWVWSLGAVAILFNPFIPIYLSRDTWEVLDFVTAVFLLVTITNLKLPTDTYSEYSKFDNLEESASIKDETK